MKLAVRPYEKRDYARVLDICIAAFEPIHRAFEQALGMRIFKLQYQDWKEQYAETLRKISARDRDRKVHVVELDGAVVGFILHRHGREAEDGRDRAECRRSQIAGSRHRQGDV